MWQRFPFDSRGQPRRYVVSTSPPFIRAVSEKLNYIEQIQRKIQLFRHAGATKATPEESATIVRMKRLILTERYEEVVTIGESLSPHDPILANPKIRAFLGQAYSNAGGTYREKARECFRAAEAMNYRDIYMMRAWYQMELRSGYGNDEAIRICKSMIAGKETSPRYQSEFWSKLGNVYYLEASTLLGVSRDKGMSLLRRSMDAYLEALWIGRSVTQLNSHDTLGWLERPLDRFIRNIDQENVEQFFGFLEELAEKKHDVFRPGIELVLSALQRAPLPNNHIMLNRVRGLCSRTINRVNRVKQILGKPGFDFLVDTLKDIIEQLELPSAQSARTASSR
jgi:hypothetical protein